MTIEKLVEDSMCRQTLLPSLIIVACKMVHLLQYTARLPEKRRVQLSATRATNVHKAETYALKRRTRFFRPANRPILGVSGLCETDSTVTVAVQGC